MSNAAIYFHPEAFNTATQSLMGRHAAGESFMRGFLRHADVDRFHIWNIAGRAQPGLEDLLNRLHPPERPVNWIDMRNRIKVGEVGVANLPIPEIGKEAWQRAPFGPNTYAICGITHTTATATVMNAVADMLIAPTEPFDTLICTSSAVRASIETQLSAVRDYLKDQFGTRTRPEPMLATIPLGVNSSDFAHDPAQRAHWRESLGIPEDAIVALYVGRFNLFGKMNPALMAMALEAAAQKTDKKIYWVNSGWGKDEAQSNRFHDGARALCPSVTYLHVDGRPETTRFSIWSVADFFVSFSDNIQETFGLTPIEAMAAGLPVVVTDWNGYRDTVRHGVDGFRIPTFAPRPGLGADLAHRYANDWINYDHYVGTSGQFTVVDLDKASDAILQLIENPDLRARMGAAAAQHARETFDWKVVIPQYQALWGEQNARRLATPPRTDAAKSLKDNPWRMDPFRLFASYPTEALTRENLIYVPPGMTWAEANTRLTGPLAVFSTVAFMTMGEAERVFELTAAGGRTRVHEVVQAFPAGRQYFVERGMLWMAKFGVINILPRSEQVIV